MACPDGIRMGRRTRSNIGVAAIGTTVSTIVPANPNRIGLILFPDGTTDIAIGIDRNISATTAPVLQSGNQPFRMHIDQDGTMVQKGWFGIVAAGAATIGFIESLLDEV